MSTLVSIDMATVKDSTRPSSEASFRRGISPRFIYGKSRRKTYANAIPKPPATRPITRNSESNWPADRCGCVPLPARHVRPTRACGWPRASKRLAALPQAIKGHRRPRRSTARAADGRGPLCCRRSSHQRAPSMRSRSCSLSRRVMIAAISACACAMDTPGLDGRRHSRLHYRDLQVHAR